MASRHTKRMEGRGADAQLSVGRSERSGLLQVSVDVGQEVVIPITVTREVELFKISDQQPIEHCSSGIREGGHVLQLTDTRKGAENADIHHLMLRQSKIEAIKSLHRDQSLREVHMCIRRTAQIIIEGQGHIHPIRTLQSVLLLLMPSIEYRPIGMPKDLDLGHGTVPPRNERVRPPDRLCYTLAYI
ncbi:MAG: hypothetical protein UW10_C0025G0003 [Candidatus Magasanikbacteria bacterium GW2011_GWA2_43_9]|nr:MAG: hypothetical protein UW10_C0025G0003 [Candidatus Magasanikbacteria bacterium GW2011_GWA2_43_9]